MDPIQAQPNPEMNPDKAMASLAFATNLSNYLHTGKMPNQPQGQMEGEETEQETEKPEEKDTEVENLKTEIQDLKKSILNLKTELLNDIKMALSDDETEQE